MTVHRLPDIHDLLTDRRLPSPMTQLLTDFERWVIDGDAPGAAWPAEYVNRDTGRVYQPHHEDESEFVYQDGPWRYGLARGGEGGGKSVGGIIKGLNRVKRGLDGIIVSPDFPHFKRSLWPEYKRWCPWDFVVPSQQYRQAAEWYPFEPFTLTFTTGATVYFGGIENPISWEGPNVNWAHFDEARRKVDARALKVLDGRVRIPGPDDVNPQLWITTTPEKHWLYDYFGPFILQCQDCRAEFESETDSGTVHRCPDCGSQAVINSPDDTFISFKRDAKIIVLRTQDNEPNLDEGFAERRGQTLTEAERRVFLGGEWEDIQDDNRFLESMALWDSCKAEIAPLDDKTPAAIAIDAGVSDDIFGLTLVTAFEGSETDVSVRITASWEAPKGGEIDFQGTEDDPGPETLIKMLCERFNVLLLVYDPYQLHDMGTRLEKERKARRLNITEIRKFSQQTARIQADTQLLRAITHRTVHHDGSHTRLREHLDNANRKLDKDGKRLRIVKRTHNKKIDLAVCLSMAVDAFLSIPLTMRIPQRKEFLHV